MVAPSLIPKTFLLRHGKRFNGKCNWTKAHYRWLEEVKFEQATQRIVLQGYIDTVIVLSKRLDALDGHLQSAASASVFWPVIEALMALRGVNLLAAKTIVAEIGDLKRFANAPQLMAYRCPASTPAGPSKRAAASPRLATATCAGCWCRRLGLIVTRQERRRYYSGVPSAPRKSCRTLRGRRKHVCARATPAWRRAAK